MIVEWVVGVTGSGKTHYVERISEAVHISTSEIFWAYFRDCDFSKTESAPKFGNEVIFSNLYSALKSAHGDDCEHVIVDSAPRSWEQVSMVEGIIGQLGDGYHHRFTVIVPSYEAYLTQGASRDPSRKQADLEAIPRVVYRLLETKYPVKFVRTEVQELQRRQTDGVSLSEMFSRHMNFANESGQEAMDAGERPLDRFRALTADGYKTAAHHNIMWTRRLLKCAKKELEEAIDIIPWKWWATDEVNISKLREEIIDAWHFIMSASWILGMDAPTFAKEYYQKLAKNYERMHSGTYKDRGMQV